MKLANGTGTARTEPGANRTAEPDTATRTARTGTARTGTQWNRAGVSNRTNRNQTNRNRSNRILTIEFSGKGRVLLATALLSSWHGPMYQ